MNAARLVDVSFGDYTNKYVGEYHHELGIRVNQDWDIDHLPFMANHG